VTEIAYDTPGELTSIGSELLPLLASLPTDAVEICRVAQSLLLSPDGAAALKLPEARHAEREIRDASRILATLVALDGAPQVDGTVRAATTAEAVELALGHLG